MFLCTVISRAESAQNATEKVLETLKGFLITPTEHQLADHVTEFRGLPELDHDQRSTLYNLADELKADIIIQPRAHQRKKLVVFDMDSTLIQNECIDLIAARANVQPQVADITERAMRGELDFSESLRKRVALLKGIPTTVYKDIIEEITLTPGARELCAGLQSHGVKLAVLSGGFQPIVDWIMKELKLDYAFANHLGEVNMRLTGTTEGAIVDGERKSSILQGVARLEQINLKDVCAIGDGSNDLPMMAAAGFGIAWHAKPKVQQQAPSRLNGPTLADALYILGYAPHHKEH